MNGAWLGPIAAAMMVGVCMSVPAWLGSTWMIPAWCLGALFARVRIGTTVPGWVGGGLGLAVSSLFSYDLLVSPAAAIFTTECTASFVAWRGRNSPWRWWYAPLAGLGLGLIHVHGFGLGKLLPALLLSSCQMVAWILADRPGRPVIEGRTLLATGCGYLGFGIMCLMLVPCALIAACVHDRSRLMTSLLRLGIRLVYAVTPGTRWRASGGLADSAQAPVMIANHESMLDILSSCILPGERRVMLAKPWIFRIPLLGWAASASGMRSVSANTADEFLSPVVTAQVETLLIFPEGRRSPTGDLQRFRPGAFVLARSLGCSILPVVHVGGRAGIMPGSLWIRPTTLVSHILPACTPAATGSMREFAESCRHLIGTERCRIMRERLLAGSFQPRLVLNRIGFPPTMRARINAEYQQPTWKSVIRAIPVVYQTGGHWLLLGAGWGMVPSALRLLFPGIAFMVVDPDREKLHCARCSWAIPERDILGDVIPDSLPPLMGCVLLLPPGSPLASSLVTAIGISTVVITTKDDAGAWAAVLSRHQQVDEGNLRVL